MEFHSPRLIDNSLSCWVPQSITCHSHAELVGTAWLRERCSLKKRKSLVPSCLHAHRSCFQNVLSGPCHYCLGFHSPAQLQMVSSTGILGVINQRQHPCWRTGSSRCLSRPGLNPRAASSPRHQRHGLLLCFHALACSLFQGRSPWCCILGLKCCRSLPAEGQHKPQLPRNGSLPGASIRPY